jgi:hypothetical protein
LLPVTQFSVTTNFSQPLWITLHAPADAVPGRYAGTITLSPQGMAAIRVPLQVTVYPLVLAPGPGHIQTAFSIEREHLRGILGDVTPEIWRSYGKFMLQYRLNPTDLYSSKPPSVADLEYFLGEGIQSYNVANLSRKSPEAARTILKDFMDALSASPQGAELRRRAYVYGFDEAGPSFFPKMKDLFGMIRRDFGVPTFTTAYIFNDPPASLDPYNVSWVCPLSGPVEGGDVNQAFEPAKAARARVSGHEVWAYICCNPGFPYANFMLGQNPAIESRILWWQLYREKIAGLLYWGVAVWPRPGNKQPIDPAQGPLVGWNVTTQIPEWSALHGDGLLIYPGINGPMSSIRLENIRDGIEDYEYLWQLAQASGGTSAASREACEAITQGLTAFTHNPEAVYIQRDIIAHRIASAQQTHVQREPR